MYVRENDAKYQKLFMWNKRAHWKKLWNDVIRILKDRFLREATQEKSRLWLPRNVLWNSARCVQDKVPKPLTKFQVSILMAMKASFSGRQNNVLRVWQKKDDPWCQIQCLNVKFWGWLGPRHLVHWGFLAVVNRKIGGWGVKSVLLSNVSCSDFSL